jgi:hypothetical protein
VPQRPPLEGHHYRQRTSFGTQDQKYTTTYKGEYEQPDQRRTKFITTAETVLGKLEETERNVNQSLQESYKKQPRSIEEVAPIDRMPVPGYMGHKAVFRPPIREGKQRSMQ